MKNNRLFFIVVLLPFISIAQTVPPESTSDYPRLIVQGLSNESILISQVDPVRFKTIRVKKDKKMAYAKEGYPRRVPFILNGTTGHINGRPLVIDDPERRILPGIAAGPARWVVCPAAGDTMIQEELQRFLQALKLIFTW